MAMRAPKALVIPFIFQEGYPRTLVDAHLALMRGVIDRSGIEYDAAPPVICPADADAVARDFNAAHYDFSIFLIPTWIEPRLAVRAAGALLDKPVVVWGNGTFLHEGKRVNLGSLPGAGVVKGTLREMGVNHEYIYRMPGRPEDDRWILEKLRKVANVARAMALMAHTRIGAVGYLFGGMSIGDIDIGKVRRDLGPELITIDAYQIFDEMGKVEPGSPRHEAARREILSRLSEPLADKYLDTYARIYAALWDFVEQEGLQALTMKCQTEFPQRFGIPPCIPLSVLGDRVVAGCEADMPVLLTEIVMHYLSGGVTPTYCDIHDVSDNRILIGACGFAPAGACIGDRIVCDLPDPNPTGLGATFNCYITNKNYLKAGRSTFARFLKDRNGDLELHFAVGEAVGDVGVVSELDCPQYAFTEIELDGDLDEFMQASGSHHYAICNADLREALELFCRYKGIRCLTGGRRAQ